MIVRVSIVAAILCSLELVASPLSGATHTVTDPDEAGPNSLRNKVAAANNGDTIVFAIPGPISITLGEIVIDKNLTINGPVGGITVQRQSSTGTLFRIFRISNGTMSGPTVYLSNLIMANGAAFTLESGGGILNDDGKLTLQSCTVRDCHTVGTTTLNRPGGAGVSSSGLNAELNVIDSRLTGNDAGFVGGAISNSAGLLRVISSHFGGNRANNGGHIYTSSSHANSIRNSSFIGSSGGAISTSGTLDIVNCTFFENRAATTGSGGAINNSGALTVQHCTFQRNLGQGGGASINNSGSNSSLTLSNTILSTHLPPNLSNNGGTVISLGHNLSSDSGSGFLTGGADQINTDPGLDLAGPQDNGGLTPTIELLSGSPAIDKGHNFGIATDQRGKPRPLDDPAIANAGDGSDIGAFEACAPITITPAGLPKTDLGAPYFVDLTGVGGTGPYTFSLTAGALPPGLSLSPSSGSIGGASTETGRYDFIITVVDANGCAGSRAYFIVVRCYADPVVFNTDESGIGSLREAINDACQDSTITFAPGVVGRITLTSGELLVNKRITIIGPGANLLEISGNDASRVFHIPTADGSLVISGLTIRDGAVGGPGAGVLSLGPLTLMNCYLVENDALGSSGFGGGVALAESTGEFTGCTFFRNRAAQSGGAIYYHGDGATLSLVNCTIAGNTAHGAGIGGGIANDAGNARSTLNVTSCTIANNVSDSQFGGGGITNSSTTATGRARTNLANTILANNTTPELATKTAGGSIAIVTSMGFNLSSTDSSAFLNQATDQNNALAQLGALQDNGGPTLTMRLRAGSNAIDKGSSFGLSTDQRGFLRNLDSGQFSNAVGGDGSDIGALELNPFLGGNTDSDDDGMPDDFEIFYGVDDPNGDPDGDGDSNLEEYLNGTNPRDSSSFALRIISIVRSGNDVVITFNGVAGRAFRLERKDELFDPAWLSIPGLADLTPQATGNAQLTHLGGLSIDHSFYRVRLLP